MSVPLLQFAWLALALAAGMLWALVATARRSGRGLRVAAAGATLAGVATALALWQVGGWWFAGEKLLVGAPPALGALAWFAVAWRSATWMRPAAWAGLIAQVASLAMTVVVGYPVPVWAALVVVGLAGSATWIVAVLLTGGPRRLAAAGAAVSVAVLVAGLPFAAGPVTEPSVLAAHTHPADAEEEPPGIPVTALRTPADEVADVAVTLDARQQTVALPSGRDVAAWTFGELGGPVIEATVGDLVEVTLRNRDIADGVTAHWHGYRVPNGEDGVAGVTQDAVPPGGEFVYRFVASEPGTFWYHTHQISSEGVAKGLYGPLVVRPAAPVADVDAVYAIHSFGGRLVLGGSDGEQRLDASPGDLVRLRLINTDPQPQLLELTGAPFRVVAVDGRDLTAPAEVEGLAVRIPAGGRYDLEYTQPATAVALHAAASRTAAIVTGTGDAPDAAFSRTLDPLSYGGPGAAAPTGFDVEAELVLDQLPRPIDGGFAYAYTVNGQVYPHIPSTVVDEGDMVVLTIVNRGYETHPMHPHGHVVRVLSVNGRAPTGSPLLLDTFDVAPGEVWVVALVADNPGIWMDHCHNLEHAALGMVTHLVYRGVTTSYEHGGPSGNSAE